MGGELEARLFIGPKDYKTYKEWVFLLYKSKKQIVDEIKQTKEYKDYITDKYKDEISDDELLRGWYDSFEDDVEELTKLLHKRGLEFVHEYNYIEDYTDEIRIGSILEKNIDPRKVKLSDGDLNFWKKYGIKEEDLIVFAGMDGEIC